MNNILFGVIGMLMLGITGIGYAEVKTQLHERGIAVTVQETSDAEDASTVNTATVSAGVDVSARENTFDTVPEVLSDVAARVETAIFNNWDDEDEYEDEDGDEDEDEEEDEHRSSQAVGARVTTNTSANTSATNANSGAGAGAATFTMAQVAQHGTAASCYSAIGGSVYDLTSFVTKHPGGQSAIKSLCGVDGTAAFSAQHGGQGKPESVLAQYKIGVVTK